MIFFRYYSQVKEALTDTCCSCISKNLRAAGNMIHCGWWECIRREMEWYSFNWMCITSKTMEKCYENIFKSIGCNKFILFSILKGVEKSFPFPGKVATHIVIWQLYIEIKNTFPIFGCMMHFDKQLSIWGIAQNWCPLLKTNLSWLKFCSRILIHA